MTMLFLSLLLFASGCVYVYLGYTMITEYSHTWKDKTLGFVVGGAAIAFGQYLVYAAITQINYYV